MKKLYKSNTDKKICGVCGGLAEYFGIDSSTVRLITVLLVLFAGMSIWVYIIAALIMDKAPTYTNYMGYYNTNTNYDYYNGYGNNNYYNN